MGASPSEAPTKHVEGEPSFHRLDLADGRVEGAFLPTLIPKRSDGWHLRRAG